MWQGHGLAPTGGATGFAGRVTALVATLGLLAACGPGSTDRDDRPLDTGDLPDAGTDAPAPDGSGDATREVPDMDVPGEAYEDAACGPPDDQSALTDVPRSLMPYVRLRVSGTQPRGFWPFEAEDAIATVRDSNATTSWKVPVGEPSWIEIDVQPFAGAPVSLHALGIAFASEAPAEASVDLSPACGVPPGVTLSWTDLSAPLDLTEAPAGCVRIRLPAGEALAVTGLDLTSRDPAPIGLDRTAADVLPVDIRHRDSGVIEGFYGIPWSWRERRHMMIAMAREGLGTYLYAPKNDPLHRDRWREPYPDEDMRQFGELATLATQLDVRFAFGISPFIDYQPGDADYEALKAKSLALIERGATIVAILGDDIEMATGVTADAALGALHVGVVNRLVGDLSASGATVWFTPTVYSDARAADWPGGQDYLDELANLDATVAVLWTGPDTGNATLSAADLAGVTSAIRRAPLIWDNVYANDGGDGMFGRIFLAPYSGRDADLLGEPPAVLGIAQNLSIQGALSRVSLGTFGAWHDDPSGQGPSAALDHAIQQEAFFGQGIRRNPTFDATVLRRVAALFEGDSQRDPPHFVALELASQALVAALDDLAGPSPSPFDGGAVRDLLPLLGLLAALPSDVEHSGLDADLVDDLAFPLWKAAHEGRSGLWAMAALARRMAGGDGAEELSRMDDEALLSASSRFLFSPDAVPGVLGAVRKAARAPSPPAELTPADPAPATCRPGHPIAWKPYAEEAVLEVFGLPGATADPDGTLRWTPPHGGRFQGVVTATRTGTDPAWAWTDVEFVCTDPCW